MASILFNQTLIMFLLMAVGIALYKTGIITNQGSKEMSRMLITVIIPSIIIKSYITEYSTTKLINLGIAFVFALLSLVLSILFSRLIYGSRRRIDHFGVAFSNAGFVGIPLVYAILGSEFVFYIAIYVALLNILQWTYGIAVLTDSKDNMKIRKLITNPILIALVIGLLLFLTQIPVPEIIVKGISYVSDLNTPIAMIILGGYLAQTNILKMLKEIKLYQASLVRLLLIPIVTLFVLKVLPFGNTELKLVMLIAASTPIGSNVAVFAQLHDLDYTYAVRLVCISTILSIITCPIVVMIADYMKL